jgi:hypothetical protein
MRSVSKMTGCISYASLLSSGAIAFCCSLMVVSLAVGANPKTNSRAIPLDQIWAWKMPGTKDVGKLDAVKTGGTTEHPILHDVFAGIGSLPKGKRAAPAFVVEGVGKTALDNARSVFKKETNRVEKVPPNTELSLVFYSHGAGQHFCRLVSVEKSERLIKVKYRFFDHSLAVSRIHFAFIPIGKFAPGVVEVKIEQQDSTNLAGSVRPPVREMERLVSGPFSFEVRE